MKATAIIFEVPCPEIATTPLEFHLARRDGATLEQPALDHWFQVLGLFALGQPPSKCWKLLAESHEGLAEWHYLDTGGILGHLLEVANIDVGELGP